MKHCAALVLTAAIGFPMLPVASSPLLLDGHAGQPRIVDRPRLEFLAIRARTPVAKLGDVIQKSLPEVRKWMDARNIQPSGPPIVRYLVVDMPKALDVEVGWPVAKPVSQTGRIHVSTLPAGRYASLVYTGPYDGLVVANADLQSWAERQHVALEGRNTPKGRAFAGRVEVYMTDPGAEPDPHKWQTELFYLTAPADAKPNHGK